MSKETKKLLTNKTPEDFSSFEEECKESELSLLGEFGSQDDDVQQETVKKSDKKILKG